MNRVKILDATFPIDHFGKGQAKLTATSEPSDASNVLHFCCYTPLRVGAHGKLSIDGREEISIRITERFGDFYNAETIEEHAAVCQP